MKTNLILQARKVRVLNPRRLNKMLERAIQLTGLQDQPATPSKPAAALNLVFVSENKIRRLNTAFLGRRNRTDVIAFDLRPNRQASQPRHPDNEPSTEEEEEVIAEIYVCPGVAARTARKYQTTPEEETILYLVHGLLHLAGCRDNTPKQQKQMRVEELRVMSRLQKEFTPASILRLEYHPCAGKPCREPS